MFTIPQIVGKDKIEKLKQEHDKEYAIAGEHIKNVKRLRNEIVNSVFTEYNSKEEREKLIEDAKIFSFSDIQLKRIENAFENYNKDNITYNIALDIMDARTHIKEQRKESFFSAISNIVMNEDD